jgi:peptidoglycan-associated lipoprotein
MMATGTRLGRGGWLRGMAVAAAVLLAAACETTPPDSPPAAPAAGVGAGVGGGAGMADRPGGYGQGAGGFGGGGVEGRGLGGTAPGAAGQARGSAAQVAQELVSAGDTVYFAFDSFALEGQAQTTLDQQAALLLRNPAVAVVVEGHCDDRGTREYNLALGERRATAVKDYLVAYGVNPSRIRTISYGKERPAVLGSSEAAWAKNRRATTIVAGTAPTS